jgi:hypothetical protein
MCKCNWVAKKKRSSRFNQVEAVIAVGVGLAAGLRHAADPDHVLAIAQLSQPGTSTLTASTTALLWGLGHSVTLMTFGSALVATGAVLPDRATAVTQLTVAVALLVLAWRAPRPARAAQVGRRAALVGLVHGAAGAGSAAIVALGSTRSACVALLTLAFMCFGNVVAMVALTYGLVRGSARLTPRLLTLVFRTSRLLAFGFAAAIVWSALPHFFGP